MCHCLISPRGLGRWVAVLQHTLCLPKTAAGVLGSAPERHLRKVVQVELRRQTAAELLPLLGAGEVDRAQIIGERLRTRNVTSTRSRRDHIVAVGGISVCNLSCTRNVVAAGHLFNHTILVFFATRIILRQVVPGSRSQNLPFQ